MELMVILVEVQLAGWLRHNGTMVDTRFKIMQWAWSCLLMMLSMMAKLKVSLGISKQHC